MRAVVVLSALSIASVLGSLLVAGAACKAQASDARADSALGEASGLASLGGGRFAVVDDDRGLILVEGASRAARMIGRSSAHPELRDLEGVCVVDGAILVVAEESGVVSSVTVPPNGEIVVKRLGVLPHPPTSAKRKASKGWEGIAFLPASLAGDGRAHLVAVHEGAPKAVVLFAWPSLAHEQTVALGAELNRALDDLSDVAVDAKNGELVLLSDESERAARVRLHIGLGQPTTLEMVRVLELPVAADEKPEGIAFDDAGALWIVTDATGRMVRVPE